MWPWPISLLGKRVVPELIQHDFTAANIVQQLTGLLPDGPARQSMTIELEAVRAALRVPAGAGDRQNLGAIEHVIDIVLEELGIVSPAPVVAAQNRSGS